MIAVGSGVLVLRLERKLLSNVRYFNDLIVTHTDEAYMERCETVAGSHSWSGLPP